MHPQPSGILRHTSELRYLARHFRHTLHTAPTRRRGGWVIQYFIREAPPAGHRIKAIQPLGQPATRSSSPTTNHLHTPLGRAQRHCQANLALMIYSRRYFGRLPPRRLGAGPAARFQQAPLKCGQPPYVPPIGIWISGDSNRLRWVCRG